MNTCVLASGNRKKIAELGAIMRSFGMEVVPQSQFDVCEADETGTTFVENAIIKARHAAQCTGLMAIADDSGICVPSLDGAPGVYSARYSGEGATDERNNAALLAALADGRARQAYYVCVIVLMRHAKDPLPLVAQGTWHGQVLTAPRGEGGFGYDPLFYLPDEGQTAAELSVERKNSISHRAQALAQLNHLLHHVESLG